MTLVILAAGMGSRFGGLKQIEPIDEYGNFIIDYSIYDAIKVGFTKVVFIIKREHYDLFRDTVGKRVENHVKVEYVFQDIDDLPEGYSVPEGRVKPWGTGHALLACKDVVKEKFAIINADDFYGREAYKVIYEFLNDDKSDSKYQEYAMAGYLTKNTVTRNGCVKRGLCEVSGNYLSKLIESKVEYVGDNLIATPIDGGESFEISEDSCVSMSLFGLTPHIFEYLEKRFPEFLEENKNNMDTCEILAPSMIFEEVEQGISRVEVLKTNAVWQGVTYKDDKPKVVAEIKALVDKGEYTPGLWN